MSCVAAHSGRSPSPRTLKVHPSESPIMDSGKFEKECMLYLRNLSGKFWNLNKLVEKLIDGQELLQASILAIGAANGCAYDQVKVVIDHLACRTNEVVQDLSSAMGTMRVDVFDPEEEPNLEEEPDLEEEILEV